MKEEIKSDPLKTHICKFAKLCGNNMCSHAVPHIPHSGCNIPCRPSTQYKAMLSEHLQEKQCIECSAYNEGRVRRIYEINAVVDGFSADIVSAFRDNFYAVERELKNGKVADITIKISLSGVESVDGDIVSNWNITEKGEKREQSISVDPYQQKLFFGE